MAAGQGFKTFTTGEVLTASDVNGYLMQGVLVFASSAARSAAITSPQEGQMSYLKDTDSVESYSGAAWVAVGGSVATSLGYAAGKNAIINGAMYWAQRGTSFSNPASSAYTLDRWAIQYDGTGATRTISQQTFTPGTAPVAGYEGSYFLRCAVTVAGTGNTYHQFFQRIENVQTYAGQTVTLSFWAKADSARTIGWQGVQNFGSGGSGAVGISGSSFSATTSWQRFTASFSVPSISGKTVGTGSSLELNILLPTNTTATIDIWGVQLEAGSTATAFQTATGTIQGELAACQRYYFRTQTGTGTPYICVTVAGSSTTTYATLIHKVTMRSTPTSIEFSAIKWQAINNSGNISAASISDATPESTLFVCTTTGATAGVMNYVIGQTTSAYMAVSAEL